MADDIEAIRQWYNPLKTGLAATSLVVAFLCVFSIFKFMKKNQIASCIQGFLFSIGMYAGVQTITVREEGHLCNFQGFMSTWMLFSALIWVVLIIETFRKMLQSGMREVVKRRLKIFAAITFVLPFLCSVICVSTGAYQLVGIARLRCYIGTRMMIIRYIFSLSVPLLGMLWIIASFVLVVNTMRKTHRLQPGHSKHNWNLVRLILLFVVMFGLVPLTAALIVAITFIPGMTTPEWAVFFWELAIISAGTTCGVGYIIQAKIWWHYVRLCKFKEPAFVDNDEDGTTDIHVDTEM